MNISRINIEHALSVIGAKIADAITLSERSKEKTIEAQRDIEELYIAIGDKAPQNGKEP